MLSQLSLDQQASTLSNVGAQSLAAYRTAEQVRMEIQRLVSDDGGAKSRSGFGGAGGHFGHVDVDAIALEASKLSATSLEETLEKKLSAAFQVRGAQLEDKLSNVERLVTAVVRAEVEPKIAVLQERILEVSLVT